mmetsp:Transcript_43708/g.132967  ORF Transcript_43708/g.132967 Transcript_43708/m.132967 type:complete len:326 (-) Transcript_43708:100-1077(-)
MFRSSVAALAVLLIADSNAFIVPSTSTFVQRTNTMVVTYDKARAFAPSPARSAKRFDHSEMSMNLIDRFVRVAKGNMNNVLNSLESPEKIMNQAVQDMQSDLIKVRQTYSEVTATQRKLLKEKADNEDKGEEWYGRAQLALRRGRDDLAREALARRQQYAEAANGVQSQIDVQAASLDKLYEGMGSLEEKILEAKAKKEQYVARAKTAEGVTKVNDMLGGLTGKTSMDAFRRMEEKVEALEAAAEASAEMSGLKGYILPGSEESKLEQEFALLEGSAEVDRELEKMKSKLLSGSAESKRAVKGTPEIEHELKKMKKSIQIEWQDE